MIGVLEESLHRLAVAGAEFEDVPDLDAARLGEPSRFAARTGISGDGGADVSPTRHGEVVPGRDVDAVRIRLVGAHDVVGAGAQLVVRIDRDLFGQPDGSGESHRRASHPHNGRGVRQLRACRPDRARELGQIQLAIAANERRHRPAVRHADDGLHDLVRTHFEKGGYLLDRVRAGRSDDRRRQWRRRLRRAGGRHLGPLCVGSIAAALAAEHRVLTAFGEDHELVVFASADRAGIGLDGQELEAAAPEDVRVGPVVGAIDLVQALLIHVEGVAVEHGELAAADESTARPGLVSLLGLDLVEIERKLLPGRDCAANDVCDDLFMGESEEEISLVLVL